MKKWNAVSPKRENISFNFCFYLELSITPNQLNNFTIVLVEYSTTLVGEAAIPWILKEAGTVVEFLKKKNSTTVSDHISKKTIKRNNQVIFYSREGWHSGY